jgi:hypothetical protein
MLEDANQTGDQVVDVDWRAGLETVPVNLKRSVGYRSLEESRDRQRSAQSLAIHPREANDRGV